VGHDGDGEVAVDQLAQRRRVAVKAAVVLYLAVFDRGVQVESDEDALSVVEVVEGLERHTRRLSRRRFNRFRLPWLLHGK